MGNLNNQQQLSKFNPQQWQLVSPSNSHTPIYQNCMNKRIHIQQHRIYHQTAQEQSFQKYLFQRRLNHPQLISSLYFQQKKDHKNKCCSVASHSYLFLEQITLKLSDIKDIRFPYVLHLYNQALLGYYQLSQILGQYFSVQSQFMGINNNGVLKVWCCGAKSELGNLRGRSEQQMVKSIVQCLEEHIDRSSMPQNNPSIRNYLYRQSDTLNFNKAIQQLIRYIVETNRGLVPVQLIENNSPFQLRSQRQSTQRLVKKDREARQFNQDSSINYRTLQDNNQERDSIPQNLFGNYSHRFTTNSQKGKQQYPIRNNVKTITFNEFNGNSFQHINRPQRSNFYREQRFYQNTPISSKYGNSPLISHHPTNQVTPVVSNTLIALQTSPKLIGGRRIYSIYSKNSQENLHNLYKDGLAGQNTRNESVTNPQYQLKNKQYQNYSTTNEFVTNTSNHVSKQPSSIQVFHSAVDNPHVFQVNNAYQHSKNNINIFTERQEELFITHRNTQMQLQNDYGQMVIRQAQSRGPSYSTSIRPSHQQISHQRILRNTTATNDQSYLVYKESLDRPRPRLMSAHMNVNGQQSIIMKLYTQNVDKTGARKESEQPKIKTFDLQLKQSESVTKLHEQENQNEQSKYNWSQNISIGGEQHRINNKQGPYHWSSNQNGVNYNSRSPQNRNYKQVDQSNGKTPLSFFKHINPSYFIISQERSVDKNVPSVNSGRNVEFSNKLISY